MPAFFFAALVGLLVSATWGQPEKAGGFWQAVFSVKQILPLLFAGILVAGLLLGQPESEGLIPSQWVAGLVGSNSIWANFFASIVGAFMYRRRSDRLD